MSPTNLLDLTYKLAGAEKATDDTYHFLGQPFARIREGEIDASYHYKLKMKPMTWYTGFLPA